MGPNGAQLGPMGPNVAQFNPMMPNELDSMGSNLFQWGPMGPKKEVGAYVPTWFCCLFLRPSFPYPKMNPTIVWPNIFFFWVMTQYLCVDPTSPFDPVMIWFRTEILDPQGDVGSKLVFKLQMTRLSEQNLADLPSLRLRNSHGTREYLNIQAMKQVVVKNVIIVLHDLLISMMAKELFADFLGVYVE